MEDSKPKKIRNIPHIEGNFNVFFYIKIKQSTIIKNLLEEIAKHINNLKDKPESSFSCEKVVNTDDEYYHVSLTETIFLKYHEIANFLKNIKTSISQFKAFSILLTSKIKYFNNTYKTRHFLILQIFKTKQLAKLLSIFSNEEFSPHMSLLWSDKSFSNCILEENLNKLIDKSFSQNEIIQTIDVSEIYYTIGSRHNKIKLNVYLFNDALYHDCHEHFGVHGHDHDHDYLHDVHTFHQ
jgi:hypothetical protein